MASEQPRREDVSKIEVEKDRVPKMTTHFESLAQTEGRQQGLSLEEISKLRGTAQQSSVEAIRAAEDRYEKANQQMGTESKGLKDQALEKVAEATKVVSNVAGYTKDKVVGAGQTVAGYTGEKLAAVKDAVVAAEEKAADYAARKKAEAQRDLEAKKSSQEQESGSLVGKEQHEEKKSEALDREEIGGEEGSPLFGGGAEKQGRGERGGEQKASQGRTGTGSGSVLQAIGETIVEIGQTTKDLLLGQDKDKAKRHEEPYTGSGGGI
ncbi:late embryogenesis abundant domain-containing protein / LEA domain-containing protein [Striga hermonthica]|uniref:Late embryogenesis abundant domain-containing protein / LEA domain-containing protein n=1 Tax=Striga hermonthica TaxID=68872 RepID=A0A9N7R9B1_STRHE|nr:late embryogenesis abundant domain-containing protein / LEA domain-containing protein [Striga hermonthica]